jgi:cytochrome c peroxidase
VTRVGLALVAALGLTLALFGPGSGSEATAQEPATGQVSLGKTLFFDTGLSEPPGTSCASCHDPARAFSGDNGSGVGVARGSTPGRLARRSTPSLLYLAFVPRFRFFRDDEDDGRGFDPEPYGGFFWDGRADSIAEVVPQPLLNPREMNNRDAAQIAEKLRRAPYAEAFRREFPGALDRPESAVAALATAISAFLTTPAMAPFSSKYDDFVHGAATLTPEEQQGLALFKDPQRGGCARCHKLADPSPGATHAMFTDFGYEAVGAPRNARLRVRDEDRGLCERTDTVNPSDGTQWCVSFRTPSLRNVALRKSFMHNGAFSNLRDVVRFYATRSTDPARWYPSGVKFDDTPPPYRGLIDSTSAPYNRVAGDKPAFDDAEIDALVAFLRTLTDQKR